MPANDLQRPLTKKSVEKDRQDLRRFRQWRTTIAFMFQENMTLALAKELEDLDNVIEYLQDKIKNEAGPGGRGR